jgi:Na+-driven multidrug efflux pump
MLWSPNAAAREERVAHGNGTSSHSLDVTQGVIWRQLAALFLPVLAGAVFQELYTLANAYVIGRYASLTALGSIQATATLTDLTISISMGVGIG